MRFAVQILYFDCDQFILKTIENCAPFVDKIFIIYSPEPWSAYNKSARLNYKNPSNPEILKQSKYYSKIQLITGTWEREDDQRNECLEIAREQGFDYLIIQDADEFYNPEEYQKNINQIIANPDHLYYRCIWYIFWKSTKYVVLNFYPYFFGNQKYVPSYKLTQLHFNPCFAVNCKKDVKFADKRMLNTLDYFMLDGVCFHLSYVLNDEQLESKIHTWGHSHQVDIDNWLKTKWYGWTQKTKNLNPISLINWHKAVEYKGDMPKEIADYNAGTQKYIKPKLTDILRSQKKEWLTFVSFLLKDAKYLLTKKFKKSEPV